MKTCGVGGDGAPFRGRRHAYRVHTRDARGHDPSVKWEEARSAAEREVGGLPIVAAASDAVHAANLSGRAVQVLDPATLPIRDVITLDGDPTAVAVRGDRLLMGTNLAGILDLAR